MLRFEDGNSTVTDVESIASWYELGLKLQIRHFEFLLFRTYSCISFNKGSKRHINTLYIVKHLSKYSSCSLLY